ncbi:MAG TPA: hypothetical protein VLN57_21110 [Xanthobacteraceae bacterium]|nr:hypothetical protein [Xanthobacteraceae bacterium]
MAPKKKPDDDGGEGDGDGPFTAEQLEALGTIVNGAVGDHLKRKLPAIVEGSIKKPLQEIRELLAGKQGAGEGDETGEETEETEDPPEPRQRAGKANGQRRQAAQPDPAIAQMAKKLAKVEAERAAEKAERDQERAAARNEKRDGSLRELLGAAGVDPNRLRGAVAVLRESTKYDDKNNEWLIAAGDEEFDLAAGVNQFVATDEGKAYLAPQQGRQQGNGQPAVRSGAGTRTGGTVQRGAGRPVTSAADAKSANRQQAAAALQAAVGDLLGGNVPLG